MSQACGSHRAAHSGNLSEDQRYKLMRATVLPRPIAWVTSQDRHGLVNAAPFSFFNVFGTEPATLGIGVGRNSPTQPKDSCLNIRATEEFVVNLVPFSARAPISPAISSCNFIPSHRTACRGDRRSERAARRI